MLTNHGYLNCARHRRCRLLSQVNQEMELKPLYPLFLQSKPLLLISQVGEASCGGTRSVPQPWQGDVSRYGVCMVTEHDYHIKA